MSVDYDKLNKAYKNFVKCFGIVVFCFMYIMFIIHLIVYRDIIVFLVGIGVTGIVAVMWKYAIKILVR